MRGVHPSTCDDCCSSVTRHTGGGSGVLELFIVQYRNVNKCGNQPVFKSRFQSDSEAPKISGRRRTVRDRGSY